MADKLQLGIVITADGSAAERGLGKVKTQLTGVKAATQEVSEAAALAKSAFAAMASAFSVRAVIQQADAYAQLTARLKLSSGTLQEYAQSLATVQRIANTYQQDLGAIGQTYQQLAPAVQKLGMSQRDLGDILAATAAGLKVSGTSAGAASGFMTQFAQALNSSTVQAEEWNSIQDGNLALVNALEKQMPDLIAKYGNLKAAINDQAVTNEMLARAIQGARAELETQAAGLKTVSGALTVLQNDWTEFIGQLDKAATASQKLIGVIGEMSGFLKAFSQDLKASFGDGAEAQMAALAKRINEQEAVLENMRRIKGATGPLGDFLIDPEDMARRERSIQDMEKALADLRQQAETPDTSAQPFFDGVKRGADSAHEAVKKLSKATQDIQARGGSIIATGSKYLGMGEGNQSSILVKFLNEYSGTTAKSIAGDVNAWCARFVSAVLGEAKIGGLPTMSAKAYAGYGQPVWKQGMSSAALSEVMPGDIAVFTRKGGGGHVGFVKATDPGKGLLDILGGNQSNKVSIIQRSIKDLIAIRRVTGDSLKDFEASEQAIEKEKAAYEKAVAAKKKAQDEAFASLKLHQDDAAKAAEDYASAQVAKLKTSLAALKAEEEAQQRVTAAELASAKTFDEKQALLAQAAQQSAAFHASEQSLILAEIDLQQKALEAKRAAYVNELKGAQAGQYAQDEAQQLALKQAIRAVDTDLAQLAQTRAQAEITAGAQTNEHAQQSLNLKQQEAGFIEDTIAAYQREMEILQRLTAAKQAGASADQLSMLRQYYEQGAQLPNVVSAEQLARVKQYQLSTLAVKEAVDALTKSTTDQKDAEQAVREEQLRQNAYWDQLIGRIQDYARLWNEVSAGGADGFATMAVAAHQYIKQIDQIGNAYGAMREKIGTSMALDMAEGFSQAAASLNMVGNALVMVRDQYKEGTAEYQKYQNAAGAVAVAAKIATLSEAILAVVHQLSSGDPYTAIPRALAVAAMLASMGISTGASGGSGGISAATQRRQEGQGTGSVFGDTKAQSQSIANSLEAIRQNSSNDLSYSAAMLREMEDLNASILALANNLAGNVMPAIDATIKASGMKFGKTMLDPFSGFNKQLTDQGIGWFEQSLSSILSGKFQGKLYADITKTFEIMGSAVSSSTKTYIQDAGDTVNAQITRIFRDIVTTFQEGAKAFGLSAGSIMTALKGFKVGQQQISLKDMNLEEQQQALGAVFSKITDDMASQLNRKLKLGLAPFEKAGEGMAQTFLRVADGINTSKGELEQLGMTAVNYQDIVNKQGDVAAEMVRQTILAQAQMSYGVTQYVNELTGSAEDIIKAWQQLKTAADLMRTSGLQGGDTNLNRTLINAAGGLDAFVQAMRDFQEGFLSEAERIAGQSQLLAENFSRLGVAMPTSKDGFKALLDSIDQTTTAGQKLWGTLISMSGAFAKLEDQIKGIQDKYADILNPMGKYGAQIDTVIQDFNTLLADALNRISANGPDAKLIADKRRELDRIINGIGGQKYWEDQKGGKLDEIDALATKIYEERQRLLKKGITKDNAQIKTWLKDIEGLNQDIAGIDLKLFGSDELNRRKTDIQQRLAKNQADLWTAMAIPDSALTPAQRKANKALIKQLQDEQQALYKAMGDVQKQLDDPALANGLKQQIDAKNKEIAEAIANGDAKLAAELQAKREEISTQAGQALIHSLQDVWDQLTTQIQAGRDQFNAMAEKIAGLKGGTALPEAQYQTAAGKTQLAQAALNDFLRTDNNAVQEIPLIKNLQDAIYAEYEAKLALINAEKAALETQKTDAEKLLSDWSSKLSTLTQQLEQIKSIQESLSSTIGDLMGSIAGDSIAFAKQKYDEAGQAIKDYIAAAESGTPRDPERELKLLGEAQTAVNNFYQKQIDAITKANQAVIDGKKKEMDAATQAHDAQIKALQKELDAARKLSDAVKAAGEYAKGLALGQHSDLSPERKLAEAQRQYQALLGQANTGDADAIAKMTGASDAYLQAARDYYGSGSQYSTVLAGVQDAMTSLGAMNVADADSIQAHIDALNESYQSYMDAMNASIDAISDPDRNGAITALKQQQIADLQKLQGYAGQTATLVDARRAEAKEQADKAQAALDQINAQLAAIDNSEEVQALKERTIQQLQELQDRLNAAITAADTQAREQMAQLIEQATQSTLLQQEQVDALRAMAERMGITLPSHATGGYAQAGLALVGEKGPELVRFERPAQVLTAEQTRKALTPQDDARIAQAIGELKQDMRALVVTQSSANPQIIAELKFLSARLDALERTQRIKP